MRGWRRISAWAEWTLLQLHKHLLSPYCVPHLHSAGQRRTSSSALPKRSGRICRAQWGLLLGTLTQDRPLGLDGAPGPIAPRPVTCRLSCYASTEPSYCAALGARLDPCPQESGGVQPGGGFWHGNWPKECPEPCLSQLSVELDLSGSGLGLAVATVRPGLAAGGLGCAGPVIGLTDPQALL